MEGITTFSLISVMSIAFIGSISHCVGMCGGIAIAYSSSKIDPKSSKLFQILAHLSYSFGRVTTYTLLGAIFGFLGGVTTFSNTTSGIFLALAAIAMILAGLSLIGKVKFLVAIEHSILKQEWYKNYFSSLLSSNSSFSFYLLGILNGLLPCGFVYFFAITAASSASAFSGALIMFLFGISTIPAMFSLSFFVGIFKNTSFRDKMLKVSAFAVIGFGLYTLYRAFVFLFDPNASILSCHI